MMYFIWRGEELHMIEIYGNDLVMCHHNIYFFFRTESKKF